MAVNYMNNETVWKYYKGWIDRPTAFKSHPLDKEQFYKFVKACVQFAKGGNIRMILDTSELRLCLIVSYSSHGNMSESVYRWECDKVILRFEELIGYETTNLD